MKLLFKRTIFFTGFLISVTSYSQNAIIDYYAWNIASPPCDVFAGGVNVPATVDGNSTNLSHGSLYGQPK